MVISLEHKYIFISAPKTGSQTIRDFLLQEDKTALWNTFKIDGKEYYGEEHIRPRDLKKLIGPEAFSKFQVITFIRNPYSKAVSGYFFYKGTKASKTLKSPTNRKVLELLNILIATILPFEIWSLIKPLRMNREYLLDYDNTMLINKIGRTEHLQEDIKRIIEELKIPVNVEKMQTKNVSKYSRKKDYFQNRLFKKLFDKKFRKEIAFYNSLFINKQVHKQ